MTTTSSHHPVPGSEPTSSSEVIEFRNAGKVFADGTEAVRDVSFGLRQGEFVSVVGPSGCGKSTLLRMASGLGPATSGEVDCKVTNLG